jgi:DNA-binding MarR family transcriptional regulator
MSGAVMDSDELNKLLLISLRKIIRTVDQHSSFLVKSYGLTIPQLLILQESLVPEGTTVSKLARAVNLSQPTVTDIVDRLLERGYLKRSPSGQDRRSKILTVTRQGVLLLEKSPSLFPPAFSQALQSLEEWEKTHILATLQRMAGMMNSVTQPL